MTAGGAGRSAAPLLIYGGTFDPVHAGHVAVARQAADWLGIDDALLIPAGDPPHRAAPCAPAPLRAEMLRRAFAADPRFRLDLRELQRSTPSYTIDTLQSLRADVGAVRPLVLLLGADAFLGLPGWHHWQQIPRLAHLAVFPRPGTALDPVAADWPPGLPAPLADPASLTRRPAGDCVLLPAPCSQASSTAVRQALAAGEWPDDLPAPVAALLREAGNPYRT